MAIVSPLAWVCAAGLLLVGCGTDDAGDSTEDSGQFVLKYADAVSLDAGSAALDTGASADLGASDVEALIDDIPEPEDLTAAVDLGVEPTDIVMEPPDEGPVAVDNGTGQTDPGGFLNDVPSQDCEALDLPVAWSGEFDGDITTNIGDTGVDGTMSFEIGCLGSKLVVWGDMTGLGQGQPFTLKIQGGYNPETKVIKAKLVEGSVALLWILPVEFTGDLEGTYDGAVFNGTWSGTNTDKTVLDADGEGTWTASPQ